MRSENAQELNSHRQRLTYTSGSLQDELSGRFQKSLDALRGGSPATVGHWIAGRWLRRGEVFERADPSRSGAVAALAPAADEQTVAEAVRAARKAGADWRRTPYAERCSRLRALARAIEARQVELAATVSLETGKVRSESLAEVQEAVDLIETYAAQVERADGYSIALRAIGPTERSLDVLKPYGTFAVIVPFNFPVALAVSMFSAAMLAGNTVVVKPSEKTPMTGAALAELVEQAQLPAGVFNLVQGGPHTGQALVEDQIDGVAFTGSAQVGRAIAARLAQGPYPRPVLAELGGKNPAIVTASADVEKAAEGVARAAFGLSGQKCSSCSRAIVLRPVYDLFAERLAAKASEWRVGDPRDAEAMLGPLVDELALSRFHDSVSLALREGRLLAGGQTLEGGFFAQPTVVDGLAIGHELTRRELFLPFVTVTPAADLDAALAEANAVDYGLTAGVFSEDQAEVERFMDEAQAGVLFANRSAGATTGAWPGAQSFCGWKSSGLTGKGGLGPYYVQQFAREQSRTIVE